MDAKINITIKEIKNHLRILKIILNKVNIKKI